MLSARASASSTCGEIFIVELSGLKRTGALDLGSTQET